MESLMEEVAFELGFRAWIAVQNKQRSFPNMRKSVLVDEKGPVQEKFEGAGILSRSNPLERCSVGASVNTVLHCLPFREVQFLSPPCIPSYALA